MCFLKLISIEDMEILLLYICLLNNTKEVGLESQPLVRTIRNEYDEIRTYP